MTEEHFTFRQIEDYAGRRMPAEEILALQRHVEGCASCREMLMQVAASGLDHVTEAQAVDYVAGLMRATEKRRVAAHLEGCEECAAMVDDLEEFRQSDPRRSRPNLVRWFLPLAAAVVLTAGISGWIALHSGHTVPAPAQVASAEVKLPPDMAALVAEATRTGRLPAGPPEFAAETRETLRSTDGKASKSEPVSPNGVRVLPERPEFRWGAIAGASSYQIGVFDENFDEITHSAWMKETAWTPTTDLPRGRTLLWQVTAKVGGARITAPAPPQPSPRFEIVTADAAEQIAAARRFTPVSHLLLAAMYAKAGLRAESLGEVEAMERERPGSALAASLRASLAAAAVTPQK